MLAPIRRRIPIKTIAGQLAQLSLPVAGTGPGHCQGIRQRCGGTGHTEAVAARRSAGILLFRRMGSGVQVLLGHMGGPLWTRRDAGAWTVPKGEYGGDEDAEVAARREFSEELGLPVPDGWQFPLGEVRQGGGKVVTVWALEGNLDPDQMAPGTFEMEWPKGSGRVQAFPELDRVAWFDVDDARGRLVSAQTAFLDRLTEQLGACRSG